MGEHGKIDTNDVTVMVEQTSSLRHVKDGLATSMGRYNKPLVATEFVYPEVGMSKNVDSNLSASPVVLAGWTAMPSSTVSGNALVAPATGQAYVKVQLKIQKEYARTIAEVLINGVAVHQESTTGNTLLVSRVFYLKPNDQITVRARFENHGSFWFWKTPYAKVLASGSYVMIQDYPDQVIDFERDMVYGTDKGFWDDAWGRYVTPTFLKQGMPFATGIELAVSATRKTASSVTTLTRGSVSGPILAQSRMPIPVIPGSKVNFSGVFRVRRTGSKEQSEAGSNTSVSVRFSLWGIGITTDEYGVEAIRPEELLMHMFTLQAAASEDESMIEYTIAENAIPDATVQSWMEGMYFTVSLVHDVDDSYGAGTFASKTTQNDGEKIPPKSASEMKYFGWSTTNPLKIKIDLPTEIEQVTENPLSLTTVAFKNRSFFEGVDGEAEMVFFGMPDQSTSVNVYNYSTTRGSLIGTFTAAAGERKVVRFTATTPKIEIEKAGANDYFIESVMNTEIREFDRVRNEIYDATYTNINEDITKISILTEEAESGSATIDFSSESLDPATSEVLKVGKRIRILARHYGEGEESRPSSWVGEAEWGEIFEGTIKKVVSTYDYKNDPIIQITAYNVGDKMDRIPAGVAFDKFHKYGGFLTMLGAKVYCNGRVWSGPVSDIPNRYLLLPAAHGDFSLLDGFTMTRNTNKEYFYVNKRNEIVITNATTDSGVRFSDVPGDGDLSYGKINRKADTETVINQVVTNEKLLDAEQYRDRELSADRPPEDLRYPEAKSQTGTFTALDGEHGANVIGVFSKSFSVVRSFTNLNDLYFGEIGPGFSDWAQDILDSYSDDAPLIRDFNVPIKNSADICTISKLDLMSSVTVSHKGDELETVVREINHTIKPGSWTVKIGFESKGNRSFW